MKLIEIFIDAFVVFFHLLEPFYAFLTKLLLAIYVNVSRVVCCSHQSDRLGYVSRTNQNVVFVPWFERCSNFNEVMGDSERAVRKMESSFRMRNVGFSVYLTCILPRFMRNVILRQMKDIRLPTVNVLFML